MLLPTKKKDIVILYKLAIYNFEFMAAGFGFGQFLFLLYIIPNCLNDVTSLKLH